MLIYGYTINISNKSCQLKCLAIICKMSFCLKHIYDIFQTDSSYSVGFYYNCIPNK